MRRAWADVLTYSRQQLKLIPQLEKYLEQYKDFERSLLTSLTEIRERYADLRDGTIDPPKIAKLEAEFQAAFKQLKIRAENYPDLKAASLFNNIMAEASELEENIAAAITIFNHNVETFNNSIQMFPHSIVNGMLNREKPIVSFSTAESAANIDFNPNLD